MPANKLDHSNNILFVPGYACTSEIWAGASKRLPNTQVDFVEWIASIQTVDGCRNLLKECVLRTKPKKYIAHSLGGLLLLELLISGDIPPQPTLIVDAFLQDPADIFKNFVWDNPAISEQVKKMLEAEKPKFGELRASIMNWIRPGWPERAIYSGARFVYGGRGDSESELLIALSWPDDALDRITFLPRTSHFLMLEEEEQFYSLVLTL